MTYTKKTAYAAYGRVICFIILAWPLAVVSGQGQTAVYRQSAIDPNPPDSTHYEKAVGYFTSPDYPSYFLGTNKAAYIYDTVSNVRLTVAADGVHYERARAFYENPTDRYQSIIASAGDGAGQLVLYSNPANYNGGNARAAWSRIPIFADFGCHDLQVADLDGDTKPDVACSGTAQNGTPAFVMFQDDISHWTGPVYAGVAGDGVGLVSVAGVNGGARTNLVGCNGATLYWYQNPGGAAARVSPWNRHAIGDCTMGVSLSSLNIGGRDIVVAASSEIEPTVWPSGLAYFDPLGNPSAPWAKTIVDSTYRDVHEIACDVLNGTPFCVVGEEEQASPMCNRQGLNDHPDVQGCRVAIFPWSGSGFASPTIISLLGTQNQAFFQLRGTEYIAGSNHNYYQAVDPAYNLWTFTFGSSSVPGMPAPVFQKSQVQFGGETVAASQTLQPATVTVTAWITPARTQTNEPVFVSYGRDDVYPYESYVLWAETIDGTSPGEFYISTTTGRSYIVGGQTHLKPGVRYFLAGVYDGSTLSLYVNGNLEGVTAAAGNLSYPTTNGLGLARKYSVHSSDFFGQETGVQIYDSALSATQIRSLFSNQAGAGGVVRAR